MPLCSHILDTEQFDEALDRRVWSLSDQRRRWDLEISMKRRTSPHEIENSMRDLITHQNAVNESASNNEEVEMTVDEEESPTDGQLCSGFYILLTFAIF